MEEGKTHIYIVSDATGQTCDRVTKAVLAQFDPEQVQIHNWPYVRTPEAVEKVARAAADHEGVIIYTLVGSEERARMKEISGRLCVNTVDILGPIMKMFSQVLESDPKSIPGLFQELID